MESKFSKEISLQVNLHTWLESKRKNLFCIERIVVNYDNVIDQWSSTWDANKHNADRYIYRPSPFEQTYKIIKHSDFEYKFCKYFQDYKIEVNLADGGIEIGQSVCPDYVEMIINMAITVNGKKIITG